MTDRLTAPAGAKPARPCRAAVRWAVACILALGAWHGRAPAASAAVAPSTENSVASPGPGTHAPDKPGAPAGWRRLLRWLGKFHILVIHFPIALLAAASLAEAARVWRGRQAFGGAVRFCVLLGAAGAAAAVVLGWLHADAGGHGAGSRSVLGLHRWLGTAAGLWAVSLAVLVEVDARRGRQSRLFRPLLWSGTLLVGLVAHLGGTLVYGARFLDW